ncbi:DUF4412 domain-containing protein [Candidatus Saganbacteria bacterium]|nr:DUF4412 domain-containing protein [Candidatus Saganbacteria bacterium]
MKLRIWVSILCLFCFAGLALAQEFSADSVMKMKNQPDRTSKMYFKRDRWRIETSAGGQDVITIYRADKNVAWMLMPQQKAYTEQALKSQDMTVQSQKMQNETERKFLGKEKVNGISCDKYLISYKTNGQVQSIYQWIGDGLAIKSAAVDGSWSSELRNIKKGPQKDPLFNPPAGYRKLSMPSYKMGPFDKPAFKEQVMPQIPGMGN